MDICFKLNLPFIIVALPKSVYKFSEKMFGSLAWLRMRNYRLYRVFQRNLDRA